MLSAIILSDVTIGFVLERYMFSEPNPGTSQRTESVCIQVNDGVLGIPLTVSPLWNDRTALCKKTMV